MTTLPQIYNDCKNAVKEKGYTYHNFDNNPAAFGKKAPMRCCIYKYNERTNKTRVIYFSSQFVMTLYCIKKKLFTSTWDFSNKNYDRKQVHIKYFYGKDFRIDKI